MQKKNDPPHTGDPRKEEEVTSHQKRWMTNRVVPSRGLPQVKSSQGLSTRRKTSRQSQTLARGEQRGHVPGVRGRFHCGHVTLHRDVLRCTGHAASPVVDYSREAPLGVVSADSGRSAGEQGSGGLVAGRAQIPTDQAPLAVAPMRRPRPVAEPAWPGVSVGGSAWSDPPPEGHPGCDAQTEKQVPGLTQRWSTAFSPARLGAWTEVPASCRARSVAAEAGNVVGSSAHFEKGWKKTRQRS